MTRCLAALLAAVCAAGACSGGSTTVSQSPSSTGGSGSGGHAAAWDVTVDARGGDASFSFANIDSVAATRAARPVVVAGATIATDQPHAIAGFDGPGQYKGEVIGVVEQADATTIRTLGGEQYTIPSAPGMIEQRWYDLSPGVLGVTRTTDGVVIARHDRGAAQPTWKVTAPGGAADDARIAGWLAGGDPILRVNRASGGSLAEVHLADGALQAITTIPAGRVVIAPSAGRFVVVYIADAPDGTTPTRAEVRGLGNGALERTFDLSGTMGAVFALDDKATIGFDGRSLWFYRYTAARRSDVTGTTTPESCAYDVYDTASGKRVRTLAQATGEWARISGSCKVHALLATADGGAIAFAVGGDRQAEIVKFDGPP